MTEAKEKRASVSPDHQQPANRANRKPTEKKTIRQQDWVSDPTAKHNQDAVWYVLTLLLIQGGIPDAEVIVASFSSKINAPSDD